MCQEGQNAARSNMLLWRAAWVKEHLWFSRRPSCSAEFRRRKQTWMQVCLNRTSRKEIIMFISVYVDWKQQRRRGLDYSLNSCTSGISVWSENCLLATFRWKRRCLLNCFHRFLRTREIFNERTFDGRSFSDVTVCFFSSFSLWSFNCFQPGQLWVHSLKKMIWISTSDFCERFSFFCLIWRRILCFWYFPVAAAAGWSLL